MRNEKILFEKFRELTEKIRKWTNRDPVEDFKINIIRLVDIPPDFSQDFPQHFGVKYEDQALLISKNLSVEILDGIIAREAFIQYLPHAVKAIPQSYDLAMEYGRQYVKDEKMWANLWSETSTSLRVEGFLYNPPQQFPILTKASKGSFLWDFLKVLYRLDDYNLKIPLNEFIHLYGEYRLFFTPKLSEREVKLLDILLNQKLIDKKEVARQLKISESRTTSLITGLIEKEVIYRYITVSFRKIGFTSYYIYYNGPADYRERIQNIFYNNSRYKYALHQFIDGAASFLMILLAPATPKFFSKLLMKCERESRNIEGTLMCFKRIPHFVPVHSYNFSTYDVKTSSWTTDWFTWFISAKRAIERKDTLPITDSFEFVQESFDLQQLIPLDLKILDYVIGYGNLKRRKLREYLKKNTNLLQERIKFLEANGIIYHKTFAKTVGLTEYTSVLLNTMDRHLLNVLKVLLEMLPYTIIDLVTGTFSKSYSATDTLNGAAILVATPQGQAIIFERYLRKLLGNYNIWIHVTTSPKRGVWRLPLDAWDDEHKRWVVT